ncbi:MAG: hypothetical protein M1827_000945 [Pycnora praestabilis]|nr:MAG: hypothetical protein M1827_000945 [Pycnora praestabilis]
MELKSPENNERQQLSTQIFVTPRRPLVLSVVVAVLLSLCHRSLPSGVFLALHRAMLPFAATPTGINKLLPLSRAEMAGTLFGICTPEEYVRDIVNGSTDNVPSPRGYIPRPIGSERRGAHVPEVPRRWQTLENSRTYRALRPWFSSDCSSAPRSFPPPVEWLLEPAARDFPRGPRNSRPSSPSPLTSAPSESTTALLQSTPGTSPLTPGGHLASIPVAALLTPLPASPAPVAAPPAAPPASQVQQPQTQIAGVSTPVAYAFNGSATNFIPRQQERPMADPPIQLPWWFSQRTCRRPGMKYVDWLQQEVEAERDQCRKEELILHRASILVAARQTAATSAQQAQEEYLDRLRRAGLR